MEKNSEKYLYSLIKDMRILIIDDDHFSRILLKKFFDKMGATCTLVSNGEDALNHLNESVADLIMLDIKMPGLNGFQVLDGIRSGNKSTPVIAQTAYAFPDEKHRIIKAGFTGYLSKPIRRESLVIELLRIFSE